MPRLIPKDTGIPRPKHLLDNAPRLENHEASAHLADVTGDGKPISLSPTEFKLLHYLMQNPDRVLSRARLLDKVWGDHVYIEERTVDVHVRRLRVALQATGHYRLIETVRGGGYRVLPA